MNPSAVDLSRSLILAVGDAGTILPRDPDHYVRPLSLDDLIALSELRRGLIDRLPPALERDLTDRGLLVPEPSPRGGTVTRVPSSTVGAPAPVGDGPLALYLPTMFRLNDDGRFETEDHDGRPLLDLTPIELAALESIATPRRLPDALAEHRACHGDRALDEDAFTRLMATVVQRGAGRVLTAEDPSQLAMERRRRLAESGLRSYETCSAVMRHRTEAHLAVADPDLVPVIPVLVNHTIAPLSLGLLFSYAMSYRDGLLRQHYDFVPSWIPQQDLLDRMVERPSVVLLSNYVWSHGAGLQYSQRIRERSPGTVIIHGGPNTPKYPADVERYFRDNPSVDVTIRGEGEATTAEVLEALIGHVGEQPPDLRILADIPGISFRTPDGVVRTPDRDRIADLDIIPSPYLTGLFDGYAEAGQQGAHFQALLETTRGCPYGCTFCDWGSATLSRVRKFSTERVFQEIEWFAKHGASVLAMADANFGMMPRDVEIATRIAEMKHRYGAPQTVSLAFAKNSMANRKAIIELFTDAGIMSEGVMSLQSLDQSTLVAIERKNIKVEKYDELASQFRRAGLPLWVELMLGLPGSTLASFTNDLQDCIAREVPVRINITDLLVNSPMNDPEYKERFRIETGGGGPNATTQVVATSTFTREDYQRMLERRSDYLLFENVGVLRQVARYVRHETGTREVDFYIALREAALADPERWPTVAFTLRTLVYLMAPPVSWTAFLDEIRRFVVGELGVPDDAALDTVIAVQQALLPSRGRAFPHSVELAHDYPAWHEQMVTVKEADHRHDWTGLVPPLRSFGPTTFTVDDPHDVCNLGLGTALLPGMDDTWDLDSPVSRNHHLKPIPVVS